MEHDDAFRIKEPFDPKVVLNQIYSMASVDGKGYLSKRSEPCLVCNKQISEGFVVILDNGIADKMQVGYCCKEHPRQDITVNAITRTAQSLKRRVAATAILLNVANIDKIEVVEY